MKNTRLIPAALLTTALLTTAAAMQQLGKDLKRQADAMERVAAALEGRLAVDALGSFSVSSFGTSLTVQKKPEY